MNHERLSKDFDAAEGGKEGVSTTRKDRPVENQHSPRSTQQNSKRRIEAQTTPIALPSPVSAIQLDLFQAFQSKPLGNTCGIGRRRADQCQISSRRATFKTNDKTRLRKEGAGVLIGE